MSKTTKNFETLHDAYAFFQEHSSEAAQDRLGYLARLCPLAASGRPVRLLDFGCGDGGFLGDLLATVGFDPNLLTIAGVEPDPGYRAQALTRLAAYTAAPVTVWAALPSDGAGPFDIVIANHVLYYVADLADTVAHICRMLAPDGIFCTTMGDHGNAFSQWSDTVYAALGETSPHYLAPDLENVLAASGRPYEKHRITYEVDFPDSPTNRVLLLRFMLGQNYGRLPSGQLLPLLDPHTANGRVTVTTHHYQFVIRNAPAA